MPNPGCSNASALFSLLLNNKKDNNKPCAQLEADALTEPIHHTPGVVNSAGVAQPGSSTPSSSSSGSILFPAPSLTPLPRRLVHTRPCSSTSQTSQSSPSAPSPLGLEAPVPATTESSSCHGARTARTSMGSAPPYVTRVARSIPTFMDRVRLSRLSSVVSRSGRCSFKLSCSNHLVILPLSFYPVIAASFVSFAMLFPNSFRDSTFLFPVTISPLTSIHDAGG
ncbi:unnamed protein product [Dicrocoelium dendriticum]|nr:unnamed protein product [Dicrocoelium dendriticum]